ncbi:hypothetical protein FEG29_05980, partial [Acinetobacter baumannii]
MEFQRLIGFGKKEEFKEILAILRRHKPDRIRVLCYLSCTEITIKLLGRITAIHHDSLACYPTCFFTRKENCIISDFFNR